MIVDKEELKEKEAQPQENEDVIEVEEEPLEDEEKATLTVEPPMVVVEPISLKSSSDEIVERITKAESIEELKELTKLFHLSLAKKEASRALTQSELVDLLLAQAKERITKRPDELSNKDVLDYMNVLQNSIDKSSKTLEEEIVEAPPLTLNQTNQEININIGEGKSVVIDDEARARILDVINALTKGNVQQQKTIQETSEEVVIVESDSKEEPKGE